jgi:hypothetical protein
MRDTFLLQGADKLRGSPPPPTSLTRVLRPKTPPKTLSTFEAEHFVRLVAQRTAQPEAWIASLSGKHSNKEHLSHNSNFLSQQQ